MTLYLSSTVVGLGSTMVNTLATHMPTVIAPLLSQAIDDSAGVHVQMNFNIVLQMPVFIARGTVAALAEVQVATIPRRLKNTPHRALQCGLPMLDGATARQMRVV